MHAVGHPATTGEAVARAQGMSSTDQRLAGIYAQSCKACHTTPDSGAPLTGDRAAWTARSAKGMPALLQSTVGGLGGMPPGGQCFACGPADYETLVPIEARVIAADEAWLSPFHGRVTGSIAVHAYYKDGYRLPVRVDRAHLPTLRWPTPLHGKLHSLKAPDFPSLYPRWADVRAVRESLDPDGRMLNAHLREVFGA